MPESETTPANANRRRPIPIPVGGFKTNEQEARWLAQTLEMRTEEALEQVGIRAKSHSINDTL
jgi:hypothetical protein